MNPALLHSVKSWWREGIRAGGGSVLTGRSSSSVRGMRDRDLLCPPEVRRSFWKTAKATGKGSEATTPLKQAAKPVPKLGLPTRFGLPRFSLRELLVKWFVPTQDTLYIWALIAANTAIYVAWQISHEVDRFLEQHFQFSGESIAAMRWHTALTAEFSHKDIYHFGINMSSLYFFGLNVAKRKDQVPGAGGRRVVAIYLAGALLGSIFHAAWWTYFQPQIQGGGEKQERQLKEVPLILGANGATHAIVFYDLCVNPLRIQYFRMIPVPAILLQALYIYQDWGGMFHKGSDNAHAVSMGGTLAGAIMWTIV